MVEDYLTRRFAEIFGASPWLVVTDVDQSAVAAAAMLRELGATDVLAVGISVGTGPIDDSVPLISVGDEVVGTMMDGIRNGQTRADNMPAWVVEQVDEWDPHRAARVLVPFTFHAGLVAGRPTWGARPARWEALEDKLVAESIWAEAGVAHEPAVVVGLDDEAGLRRAHADVAGPLGSVWAGDASSGWHGGGSSIVWVADAVDVASARAELRRRHERVRVMPFLDGVPCSIHGMVVGDDVIAFRPCEMIVLRDPAARRFRYAAVGTYWDPSPEIRDEMRAAARRVGAVLRERAGFRGVFTVDGVVTDRGFRPTELNARFGGASAMLGRGHRHLPLFVTHCAVIAADLDDLDAAALEAWTNDGADATRAARSMFETSTVPAVGEVTQRFGVAETRADGTIVVEPLDAAADSEQVVATATWGPAATGGVVLVDYHDGVPVGPPTALIAEQIARDLDRRWALGIGALEAAPWSAP